MLGARGRWGGGGEGLGGALLTAEVFEMQEARRKQAFPGLAADAKPKDFDLFLKDFPFK